MTFKNYVSTLVTPPALSPENGQQYSATFADGTYWGHWNPATNAVYYGETYGSPYIIRKDHWEAFRDNTAFPAMTAGTYDSLIFPMAYAGRSKIFGELPTEYIVYPTTRVINKSGDPFDVSTNEYLVVSGRTGGPLSAPDGTIYPPANWGARASVASGPSEKTVRAEMRNTNVVHYPVSNLITSPSDTGYQVVKPYGISGGNFTNVVAFQGNSQRDRILSCIPAGITYIVVDQKVTFTDVGGGDKVVDIETWFLRVSNVISLRGRPITPFAINIPSVSWTDQYTYEAAVAPPNFDSSNFMILHGNVSGDAVTSYPKIVRKRTGTNTNNATRSLLSVSVQNRDKENENDPIPNPTPYPTRGRFSVDAFEDYAYLLPRASLLKALPQSVWDFYYLGENPEPFGYPNFPYTWYRVSVNGVWVTDYFKKQMWEPWDWNGVADTDVGPIYIHQYTKYPDEDYVFETFYPIYSGICADNAPANVPPVGYPILYAKTGGIKNLESQYLQGETITWVDTADTQPDDNIPATITASATRTTNQITITLDDIDFTLKPTLTETNFVQTTSGQPDWLVPDYEYKIYAYIGNVNGCEGIDCNVHRANDLANNNASINPPYFADFAIYKGYTETGVNYVGAITNLEFKWNATSELRFKLHLLFKTKLPHRNAQQVYFRHRYLTVTIPAA